MTTKEDLITQHIREYESRLKHIDELFDRAQQASTEPEQEQESNSKLAQYRERRKELAHRTDELRKMPVGNWREEMIQSSGPMGVWDILAQELEDLVERREKD